MASARRARAREWAQLIAVTGAAQVVVQAVGFVSGILVIRLLPVHEYALYTLANTMLGTMTILADGGIATGVMSQGGKVWQDKQKLGAVLATGMDLRRKFAVFSLLVAVPILLFLLRKHDASWLMSVLIVLSLVPAFFSALSGTLLDIPAKLHQDIRPLQRFQVEANFGRLALMGLTMFVLPFAAVAITCAGASQAWNNWRLRKIAAKYADQSQRTGPEVKMAILGVVKRTIPGSIHYAISGQLSILMLSFFGTGTSVAQIGALSRLAAALTLVSTLFKVLAIPRFARLQSNPKRVLGKYLQALSIFLPLFVVALLPAYLFPNGVLWILGADYSGLHAELSLVLSGSLMGIAAASISGMNVSRGHIIAPQIFYPLLIATEAILIIVLKGWTLAGALLLPLCINSIACVALLIHGVHSICDQPQERAR